MWLQKGAGFAREFESRQRGNLLAKKAPSFLNEGALQGLELLAFSVREPFCPIELAERVGFEPTDGCPSTDFESVPL